MRQATDLLRRFLVTAMTAADVMTYRPVAVGPDDDLRTAARLFVEHDVDSLPVEQEGALVGLLRRLDALQALASDGDAPVRLPIGRTVASVMHRDPPTVGPDTPVPEVLACMVATNARSLPVVVGALVIGIVTAGDLVRGLLTRRPGPAAVAVRVGV